MSKKRSFLKLGRGVRRIPGVKSDKPILRGQKRGRWEEADSTFDTDELTEALNQSGWSGEDGGVDLDRDIGDAYAQMFGGGE